MLQLQQSRWELGGGWGREGESRCDHSSSAFKFRDCFKTHCSQFFGCLKNLFILFIYFWLHWVFVAAHGLSLVVASGDYSSLWCTGFSLRWLLLLWSTGSRCVGFSTCGTWAQQLWLAGSVVVAHGLSCSAACGIFPDQGSNPCPLHWQGDS